MVRIGQASDIHRLVGGRKLILGGIEIPFDKGLLGHSDADVLVHAITEAILGALGLGDLGTHFPDTDPQYANINSLRLLEKAIQLMTQKGYQIGNIDATILAEKPKLSPYIGAMRNQLSKTVQCAVDCVNIKAATNEGLDAVGRGEAMSAIAVVLLEQTVRGKESL